MEYRRLGATKERISEIGLGSWGIGADEARSVDALRAGFAAGINFVDTAEVYGTESVVGRAIKGEENVFVATKVSPAHFRYDDVIRACNASIQRLGVKAIDLYQLHWSNPGVPIAETMRAMEGLVEEGRVRYIGVSNFSVAEVREAQEALKDNKIASNQIEYSLLVRDVERGLLDYCRKEKVTVIAYSPLARGHLFDSRYARLNEFLARIGSGYGKSAVQVALNWLLCKEGVVPIPKASRREHVIEIVGASGWRLSREDIASINNFLSSHRRRSLAGLVGPAMRHPAASRLLTWLDRRLTKR